MLIERGSPTWRRRPEADLRADWGFDDERPLETDGWSGSTFTEIIRFGGRQRLILKRTSPGIDWIVRATRDDGIREATMPSVLLGEFAPFGRVVSSIIRGFLDAGIGVDGSAVILLEDLSATLGAWPRTDSVVLTVEGLDHLLSSIGILHASHWSNSVEIGWRRQEMTPLWCPLPERLTLLTRRSAERYAADGNPVGPIFLRGWEGFERHAPADALALIETLGADPAPLVTALDGLPVRGLHGDLKLANAATDGALIDWQMMLRAPVAVELGWFLVVNSAELPLPPDAVLGRYRDALAHARGWEVIDQTEMDEVEAIVGDWDAQVDLAAIVGLLLRGWRKGQDADDGITLGSGIAAADDLDWWCRRAVEAAGRRL